jgi:hypothetical protein
LGKRAPLPPKRDNNTTNKKLSYLALFLSSPRPPPHFMLALAAKLIFLLHRMLPSVDALYDYLLA